MASIIILTVCLIIMISCCIFQYYQMNKLKTKIEEQDFLIDFFEKKLFEEMDSRLKKGGVK